MTNAVTFGAFATIQYLTHNEIFIGANKGDLEGAIYAKITSTPKDIGNGHSTFTMVHDFLMVDGSTISTTDTAVMTKIHGGDDVSMVVQHTVVKSSGRFADKRGTFPSFGIHNMKTGEGVQRFNGHLD